MTETNTTNTKSHENMTMNIEDNKNNITNQETTNTKQSIDLSKNVTTNISLLVNLKRMVDVCVSRGAFRSEELSQIGPIIDTLNIVIKENIE
jgi:hypothetical protein